jgi:hypothetical protein
MIEVKATHNPDGTLTMTMDVETAKWIAQQMLYRATHFVECAQRFNNAGDGPAMAGARHHAEMCRGVSATIGFALRTGLTVTGHTG